MEDHGTGAPPLKPPLDLTGATAQVLQPSMLEGSGRRVYPLDISLVGQRRYALRLRTGMYSAPSSHSSGLVAEAPASETHFMSASSDAVPDCLQTKRPSAMLSLRRFKRLVSLRMGLWPVEAGPSAPGAPPSRLHLASLQFWRADSRVLGGARLRFRQVRPHLLPRPGGSLSPHLARRLLMPLQAGPHLFLLVCLRHPPLRAGRRPPET